jgi:tetratricopeptide (TPR) repeat protein
MDTGATDWKEKGNGYYRQKRFEEALRCYSEAVQIDPLYADAWYNLGMTCRALGYLDEAVTCFERAKKYGPAGGNANIPSRTSLKSSVQSKKTARNGSTGTRENLNSRVVTTGKNKQSLKVWAMVIVLLMVLTIALTVSIPIITGKGGTNLFLYSGSSGTDARGPAGQQGAVIAKTPAPVYSTEPSLSQDSGVIPKHYMAMKTGAVLTSFPYVLRGEHGMLNLTLYNGVSREIAKEDPYSYTGEKDRYRKFIYLPVQDPFLVPLVDAIREKTDDPDDQVRIAVSVVQQIPYDQEMLDTGRLEIRYPYQTLLDNKGVCCEKSVLLAYILHKLGYGVALLDFDAEKHTAVGIRSTPEYAYKNTGYAFIETTTPLIITDGNGEYPAFGRIRSLPEVLPAGEGKSFGTVSEEWHDAREWDRLNSLGPVLGRSDYSAWQALCRKYGIVPGTGQ